MKLLPKAAKHVSVRKATNYAVVINALQIALILVMLLAIIFIPEISDSYKLLLTLTIIASLVIIWGGVVDIREALSTRKLLTQLEGLPMEKRTARFRCCMALVWPEGMGEDIVVSGAWEGFIVEKPSGSNGFGYDPLFRDPELGLTGAELSREAKMARSHRGKALAKLLAEVEKRGV